MALSHRVVGSVRSLLFIALALAAVECQGASGMLHIYYVPIGAETLTPVTGEDIVERGRPCTIKGDAAISAVKSLLAAAKRRSGGAEPLFTNKAVRAKVLEQNAN